MSAVLQRPMSWAEFLAWEEKQELRYEFDGFQPVAMTGGNLGHEAIGGALRALLYQRLRGKPCRSWGPTTKIEVQGRIRYPDAHVNCTPFSPGDTIVPEPVVVFEVLDSRYVAHRSDRKAARIPSDHVDPALRHPRAGQHCRHGLLPARRGLDCACSHRRRCAADAGDRHRADACRDLADVEFARAGEDGAASTLP